MVSLGAFLSLAPIVAIQVRERHTVPPLDQRSRRHRPVFISLHDDSTASHCLAVAKQGQDPRRLSLVDHELSQIDLSTHIPSVFERSPRAIRYVQSSRRSSFVNLLSLERVMRLQFSQLERTYYDRVWNQCRDEFKREFQHLWQKRERTRNEVSAEQPATWTLESDGDVDMTDVHFLSSAARSCLQTPLVKLRCLCDHPQVGAHGVR